MNRTMPLLPESASSISGEVDALFFFIVAVTVVFTVGISLAIVFFAIRYRRRSDADRPQDIHGSLALELTWTLIPLGLVAIMFVWGSKVYFHMNRPPDDAMSVSVVGKRWMWKLQHPTGQREINELHVPLGRAVKLTITSEDTIHSFFVPAFRIKKDAVPGRYNVAWFRATKTGTLPPLLRRVLRHRALAHDRPGDRDGARGLPDLARRRAARRVPGRGRREAVHGAQLRHLPPARLRRPRPGADRRLRAPGARSRAATRWWPTRPTCASRS